MTKIEKIYSSKFLKLSFIILVSLITIFHRLDESPLGFDDAHYAQRAKELLKNRDFFYINPTFGDEILLDNKPPVVYWFLALSGWIFGFKNWSMRLSSGIFGFLSLIMMFFVVYYFTKNLEYSFWSTFILNFTQQFIYYSRSATPETIFNFFFWSSLFCFYTAIEKNKPLFIYLFGIFLGLAIMTRQVFGLMILIIIPVYLMVIKRINYLLNINFICALVVSMIISIPWHSVMVVKYGNSFVNNYFGVIINYSISREAHWYEYIKKIIESYWPWLPFLIFGFLNFKNINKEIKNFAILIFVSVFIYLFILHIPKFKAPQYLVVMYLPFSFISCYGLIKLDRNFILRKIFIILGILLPALWLFFPIIPDTLDSNEYKKLSESFNEIKSIGKEIFTLLNQEYWHFKNGLLFYLDKNVVGLKEADFIDSIVNTSSNFYILKWKDFKDLSEKYDFEKKIVIFSSQTESVVFMSKSY